MRLGLFGGTFDPPHSGHLIVAQDAALALRLDRIIFVPAALPPHKQDVALTPAPIRARLLQLALVDDPRFGFDTLELDRPGPSYTIDTLRELQRRQPGEWTVLMGADQFAEFDTWREPEEILRIARVAVLQRGDVTLPGEGSAAGGTGVRAPTAGGLPAAVEIRPGIFEVPVTRIDISSTAIRARVAAGLPVRYLVPPAIDAAIAELGLYSRNGTPSPGYSGS